MFAYRIKLFELMGFKVHIDASWLLLAVLIVWSLAVGYFPFVAPGLSPATYWAMAVFGLLGLAASIVVHEFAHSLVARRYDMPIRGITLFVFGGVAEMQEEPTSAKGEFLMAIAGPVTSVAIAALFYVVGVTVVNTIGTGPTALVFGYLAFINLLLAIFNMIPAFPLDGGRVLRAILWGWKGDIMWATRIASAAGSVFAFLLMALGIYSFITGNFIAGIWWFLIGVFVRAAAVGGLQQQVVREALADEPVRRFMRRDPIAVSPDLPLERLIDEYFYRYYYKSFPVAENGRLVGCVSVEAVRNAGDGARQVRAVMDRCGPDNTIAEDEDASKALGKMQQTGKSRLFVVRGDDRLIGVLSLRDLMNYLSMRLDMEGSERAGGGLRRAS